MPGRGTFTISDGAERVLRQVEYVSTSNGEGIRLPNQLERKLYEEVNACLERAGVKWNKSAKMHMPQGGVRASSARMIVSDILESGKAPRANEHDFFPTPDAIFDEYMEPHLHLSDLPDRSVVMDPSCGDGALLQRARHYIEGYNDRTRYMLVGMEIDGGRYRAAHDALGVDSIIWGDFLQAEPTPDLQADRIVMNPPYSAPGAPLLWLDHVQHAIGWLKPGGTLVAIVPASFESRGDRRVAEFRAFVLMCGGWQALPSDTFKAAGTGVETRVLWLTRQHPD
jgi:hypothetical protein